jgi:hypothetical protein
MKYQYLFKKNMINVARLLLTHWMRANFSVPLFQRHGRNLLSAALITNTLVENGERHPETTGARTRITREMNATIGSLAAVLSLTKDEE